MRIEFQPENDENDSWGWLIISTDSIEYKRYCNKPAAKNFINKIIDKPRDAGKALSYFSDWMARVDDADK